MTGGWPARPSQALGLQQMVDESHDDFIRRVEATAGAHGSRVVFINNIRGAGLG
jgi:hypothetical protein